jgi:hypothetical protein
MYDYQAATTAQLDFVFLSKWSEVKNWREKLLDNSYTDLSTLLNQLTNQKNEKNVDINRNRLTQ